MADIQIRKMKNADINQVADVESASYTNPWPADIFYQEIDENKHAHYFVVEFEGEIVGYAGMWLVVDDAQITNIAVLPEYRGKKLGEKLFNYTLQYGMALGMKRLSLEVRESNIIAQRMYRKFGMVRGGIRKNYYTDNHEDAVVMWVNV